MAHNRIKISVKGKQVETLKDILPVEAGLRVLFVAKTPSPVSVTAGHYFQGRQGIAFWNKLSNYGILKAPCGHQDDYLLRNGYGLTDVIKVPRSFGNEPSMIEYREGFQRILDLIELHRPKVTVFVYKKVLDNFLKLKFQWLKKSTYGFNPNLNSLFGTKVFVFPMPGTPCTTDRSHKTMTELARLLGT